MAQIIFATFILKIIRPNFCTLCNPAFAHQRFTIIVRNPEYLKSSFSNYVEKSLLLSLEVQAKCKSFSAHNLNTDRKICQKKAFR